MTKKRNVKNYDLPALFKFMAHGAVTRTGCNKLLFLTQDLFDKSFVTCYSTHGDRINFTLKELSFLLSYNSEEIIYPVELLRKYNFYWRILSKISWKIRIHKIFAIAPVYGDGDIICLILFVGRNHNNLLINKYYQSVFQQKMNYCLKSALLYNQAVNRLTKIIN